jgi:hypothetical protein
MARQIEQRPAVQCGSNLPDRLPKLRHDLLAKSWHFLKGESDIPRSRIRSASDPKQTSLPITQDRREAASFLTAEMRS